MKLTANFTTVVADGDVSDADYFDARGYTRKDFAHAETRIYEAENKAGQDHNKFVNLVRNRLKRMKNQSKIKALVHALEDQNYHDLSREVRGKVQ